MAESVGCARPTGATVTGASRKEDAVPQPNEKGMSIMTARVGRAAPDFVAPAYHQGEFTQVKLSDTLGKWALICFYPGDFTFV